LKFFFIQLTFVFFSFFLSPSTQKSTISFSKLLLFYHHHHHHHHHHPHQFYTIYFTLIPSLLCHSFPLTLSKFLDYVTKLTFVMKHNQSSSSWDMIADDSSQPTPPPQKRIKSSELYKKQHGLTDDQLIAVDALAPVIQQHALRRERDKSKESRDRDRSLEMKESLLSQALEGGPTLTIAPQVRNHKNSYNYILRREIIS
jgi:hypothetical protein